MFYMPKNIFRKITFFQTRVLYMSFDKFLLAVESRDLSQADKSIIRVSPFQSWVMGVRTSFSVPQQLRPELSAKWMLSILSDLPLTRKTEIFFLNDKIDQNINSAKLPNSVFFGIAVNFTFKNWSFVKSKKKTLLLYSCQLEIDHVTQQPKETCQRTCRWPKSFQRTTQYSLIVEKIINGNNLDFL